MPFFPIAFGKTSLLWKEGWGGSVRINFGKNKLSLRSTLGTGKKGKKKKELSCCWLWATLNYCRYSRGQVGDLQLCHGFANSKCRTFLDSIFHFQGAIFTILATCILKISFYYLKKTQMKEPNTHTEPSALNVTGKLNEDEVFWMCLAIKKNHFFFCICSVTSWKKWSSGPNSQGLEQISPQAEVKLNIAPGHSLGAVSPCNRDH